MSALSKRIVSAMGVEPKDEITSAFTAEEVAHIVAESRREGLIDDHDGGLVRMSLEFSDKTAQDVAVPATDLVTIDDETTPEPVSYTHLDVYKRQVSKASAALSRRRMRSCSSWVGLTCGTSTRSWICLLYTSRCV